MLNAIEKRYLFEPDVHVKVESRLSYRNGGYTDLTILDCADPSSNGYILGKLTDFDERHTRRTYITFMPTNNNNVDVTIALSSEPVICITTKWGEIEESPVPTNIDNPYLINIERKRWNTITETVYTFKSTPQHKHLEQCLLSILRTIPFEYLPLQKR